MYITAYLALLLALLCSLGGCGFALIQLWEGRTEYCRFIGRIQWLVSLCYCFASAALLHALFWEDYRLEYVASYTDNFLPIFYRLTAFWAGQPGSLLFWGAITAFAGSIWHFIQERKGAIPPECQLWFWCLFYLVMAFFGLLLTGWSNPFIMLDPSPADGQGLNPLLQNPGMIFHPPLLFMGYALFTIPACLGFGSLATGTAANWFRLCRPFIILAWIFLTAGILLGAWWAYMELGWGGYWGWDPVENSSLLPWLSATAALHILALQNHGGKLGRLSVFLMGLTVVLAFFATYLTRSGIIQSVHAFGDGGVGTPLLVFVAAGFLLLLMSCLVSKSSGEPLAPPVSREGSVLLTAWILLALAIIIMFATLWPVLSGFAGSASVGLDAAFYNQVCLPLGAILVAILAICPFQGWIGGLTGSRASFKLIAVAGVFFATGCVMWILEYRQPVSIIAAAAAMSVICGLSMRIFNKNLWQSPRARSAFGAHLGLALLVLGVAFSGPYSTDRELLLAPGEKGDVGAYLVTLSNIQEGEGAGYDFLKASLSVQLDGREVGVVSPERRIYAKFGSMQFSEVDVISSPGLDIYASLLGVDEDHRALVKVTLEPMVSWIWIGGILMCVLPLLGFWRFRRISQ